MLLSRCSPRHRPQLYLLFFFFIPKTQLLTLCTWVLVYRGRRGKEETGGVERAEVNEGERRGRGQVDEFDGEGVRDCEVDRGGGGGVRERGVLGGEHDTSSCRREGTEGTSIPRPSFTLPSLPFPLPSLLLTERDGEGYRFGDSLGLGGAGRCPLLSFQSALSIGHLD